MDFLIPFDSVLNHAAYQAVQLFCDLFSPTRRRSKERTGTFNAKKIKIKEMCEDTSSCAARGYGLQEL